jgi:RNA polymerase sigma-70 factor (ECF subfamily)
MFFQGINERTDMELVQFARLGDKDAFGELVKRHHSWCVGLASFILRDKGDAEDEAQNAYWKAFQHLNQFHGDAEFSTWLSRIVVNQCRMFMRGRRRMRLLHLDAGIPEYGGGSIDLPSRNRDPEGELGTYEVREVLASEVRRIPPLLRNVLMLRDVEGLPMAEVADRLGISVPAAKSRLLRARIELRSRVLRHCGPSGYAGLIATSNIRLDRMSIAS